MFQSSILNLYGLPHQVPLKNVLQKVVFNHVMYMSYHLMKVVIRGIQYVGMCLKSTVRLTKFQKGQR